MFFAGELLLLVATAPDQLILDCRSWEPAESFDERLVGSFWRGISKIDRDQPNRFHVGDVVNLPRGAVGEDQFVVGKYTIIHQYLWLSYFQKTSSAPCIWGAVCGNRAMFG